VHGILQLPTLPSRMEELLDIKWKNQLKRVGFVNLVEMAGMKVKS